MYAGVLAVGFLGALLARFRPAGMARALLATALAELLVAAIALLAGRWRATTALMIIAPDTGQTCGRPGRPDPPHSGAVALFLERARRTQPGLEPAAEQWAAIVRLAHLTQGHPLALELAAAQLRSAPLDTIVADLIHDVESLSASFADAPARHCSVTAALEYAWRARSPAGRDLLPSLSACRGGCTREAAAGISGIDGPALQSALAELVEHGLLARDGRRYYLHELVLHYTRQRVGEEAQLAVAARHARHFLGWLGRRAAALKGAQQRVVRRARAFLEQLPPPPAGPTGRDLVPLAREEHAFWTKAHIQS